MSYQFSEELDTEKLQELYLGDASIACEVFGAFVEENASIVPTLQSSFDNNDIKDFARFLHKIKPGFLYVGLSDLYRSLSDAEAKCSSVSELSVMRDDFDTIINRIRETMGLVTKESENLKKYVLS